MSNIGDRIESPMSTYLQFRRAFAKLERPKRLYWLCGGERRLVEEVIDLVVNGVDAESIDRVRLNREEVPDADVWAALHQLPFGNRRLTVVRGAEAIRRWEPLAGWLKDPYLRSSYALFVSNEERTDTSTPHMQLIMRKGTYVRCGPFRPPDLGKPDRRIEVLRLHGDISPSVARYLLAKTRGDMSVALNFMRQCSLFSGTITEGVVDALVSPVAVAKHEFVDALISLRPADAIQAAESIDDPGEVIGLLDYKLDALSRIHFALRAADRLPTRRQRFRATVQRSGLPAYVVRELAPHARRYDSRRTLSCLEALVLADTKVNEGETALILEVLVTFWMAA